VPGTTVIQLLYLRKDELYMKIGFEHQNTRGSDFILALYKKGENYDL
jgi:hypothetical protein